RPGSRSRPSRRSPSPPPIPRPAPRFPRPSPPPAPASCHRPSHHTPSVSASTRELSWRPLYQRSGRVHVNFERYDRALNRWLANRGAVVGAILVALLLIVAILGPLIVGKDPLAPDIERGLTSVGAPLPPSADSLLGTDQLGRDVMSRIVAGAGTS